MSKIEFNYEFSFLAGVLLIFFRKFTRKNGQPILCNISTLLNY